MAVTYKKLLHLLLGRDMKKRLTTSYQFDKLYNEQAQQ